MRASCLHDSAGSPAPKRLKVQQQQQQQLISKTGTAAQGARAQPKPVVSATAQHQQMHGNSQHAADITAQQKSAAVKTAPAQADSKEAAPVVIVSAQGQQMHDKSQTAHTTADKQQCAADKAAASAQADSRRPVAVVRTFQLRRQIPDNTAADDQGAGTQAKVAAGNAAETQHSQINSKTSAANQPVVAQNKSAVSNAGECQHVQGNGKTDAAAQVNYGQAQHTVRDISRQQHQHQATARSAAVATAKSAAVATAKPAAVATAKRKRQEPADSLDTEQPNPKRANSSEDSTTSTVQDQSQWVRRSRRAQHVDYTEHDGNDVKMEDAPELSVAAAVPKRKKNVASRKAVRGPWR